MSTSICAYATILKVKERMTKNGVAFGTGDDSLIQSLCDQTNDWLETQIGRPVGPWPAFSTTVTSGFGAGTNTGILGSVAGLYVGEAIMFGAVTGVHEHGIVSSISGTTVTLQANLVSSYAAAQPVKRVYLFDGRGSIWGYQTLLINDGITSVTSLEVATGNPAAYTLIAGTDFFLEPFPSRRKTPAWAATRITMSGYTSATTSPLFYYGYGTGNPYGNVRIDGVPGLLSAIPDAITGLAQKLVVAAFRTSGSAGSGMITVGSDGMQTYDQSMSPQDWQLLKSYTDQTPGF